MTQASPLSENSVSASAASRHYAPALALSESSSVPGTFWVLLGIGAVLFYFFFSIDVWNLGYRWYSDVGWSHGFLVPVFSVFLVGRSWSRLTRLPLRPSYAIGIPVLLFGCISHIVFLAFGQYNCAEVAILITLIGLTLFLFGVDHLRLLWLPIIYLAFAIPPPDPLFVAATTPLQNLAASTAAMILPLTGIPASQNGVTIVIPGMDPLDVAEACSGMRMLVAFFALAVILGYSSDRPMWQKLVLAVSALPIAVFCNAMRVVGIGILYFRVNPDYARGSTHLLIGMLMLIPAGVLILALAWVLDHLFVEAPDAAPAGAAVSGRSA
jgi:exosortase